MADAELARALDKAFHKFIADLRVHIDALHGDADLAGVGEASGDAARDGFVQVRIILDDDCGVRAQFERDPLHAGQIADAQAHVDTAGERHHGDALIEDEHVADRASRPGDYVQSAGWQSAFLEDTGGEDR